MSSAAVAGAASLAARWADDTASVQIASQPAASHSLGAAGTVRTSGTGGLHQLTPVAVQVVGVEAAVPGKVVVPLDVRVALLQARGSPSCAHLYETDVELYASIMATMNISDARNRLPDAMETARTEAVFVQRRGRLAGVLVSPERYEQLMTALEDVEDVAALDAAMAEEGPNIPWEQVKADLGWE